MRRKDREISEKESILVLEKGFYGVLCTVGKENKPYGVPLNYYFSNGAIYFHSAMEGLKIDNFTNNPDVCFCVVGECYPLVEKFSTAYKSVIVFGRIAEVFGDEKVDALIGLIKKYAPSNVNNATEYIKKYEHTTRVFKIMIHKITGKARK